MLSLGNLYEDKGQPAKAMEIYEQVVQMTPDGERRSQALRRIGAALHKQGNLPGAIEKWTEALNLLEKANDQTQMARLLCDIGAARRASSGINAPLQDFEPATMLLSTVTVSRTYPLALSLVATLYACLAQFHHG